MTDHRVYRIVKHNEGEYRTLRHPTRDATALDPDAALTRLLVPGAWYKARNHLVRDGSGDGWYWSGFHCFMDQDTAESYRQKFKDHDTRGLVVVPALAHYLSTKPTNRDVVLAQLMAIRPDLEKG